MATKYFYYSTEQLKLRKQVEAKMGKSFVAGYVFVNGLKKPFTEITSTKGSSRFSDAKLVASGDPNLMKYTMPSSK
jgi:hypothetical protein